MEIKTVYAILRVRRGSHVSWLTHNPILREGEPGVVTSGEDAGKMKVGDGHTAWNDLGYVIGHIGPIGPAGTIEINDVITVDPGEDAAVENIGTLEHAVLNFAIPKGKKGDKGDPGDYENHTHGDYEAILEGLQAAVTELMDWKNSDPMNLTGKTVNVDTPEL